MEIYATSVFAGLSPSGTECIVVSKNVCGNMAGEKLVVWLARHGHFAAFFHDGFNLAKRDPPKSCNEDIAET